MYLGSRAAAGPGTWAWMTRLMVEVEVHRSELRSWESRSDGTTVRQGSAQAPTEKGQSHPFAEGRGASAGRAEAAVRSHPGRESRASQTRRK